MRVARNAIRHGPLSIAVASAALRAAGARRSTALGDVDGSDGGAEGGGGDGDAGGGGGDGEAEAGFSHSHALIADRARRRAERVSGCRRRAERGRRSGRRRAERTGGSKRRTERIRSSRRRAERVCSSGWRAKRTLATRRPHHLVHQTLVAQPLSPPRSTAGGLTLAATLLVARCSLLRRQRWRLQ